MNFLKNFKKTLVWRYIILLIIKPIYDFIWMYIINFHAKIIYFLWKFKKRDYFDLGSSNQLIIKNDPNILNLANELNTYCTKEIISESTTKIKKKDGAYLNELFDDLPENLKEKIIDFASSDKIINTVASYLGVFPILSRIYFYHNIPVNEEAIRAQRWHKDGMGYKGLDFFISITDIDHNNGPLFFNTKKSKLGVFEKIEKVDKTNIKGGRNKVSDVEFEKIFNKTEISNIIGNKGTCVIVDSYNCYHKGGHCKNKDRIMLRIAFDTIDSTVVNLDEEIYKSNQIFYYNKKNIKEVKDIFLRFLMFKRSAFMKKFKIPQKLLKIYQFFHYKIN